MLVDKYLQSNKAAKDFRRIEQYFKDFCETPEQLGMSGYSEVREIILRGIQVAKNCKAVGTKYSQGIL